MNYKYKELSVYYEKGKILYLIPKGEFLPFGGGIDVEPVFEIRLPTTPDILQQKLSECLDLCWDKTVNGYPKGPSVIEKATKIKGYKKIVRKYDFFSLTYLTEKKIFEIEKLKKAENEGCYSDPELEKSFENELDIEFILNLIQ